MPNERNIGSVITELPPPDIMPTNVAKVDEMKIIRGIVIKVFDTE